MRLDGLIRHTLDLKNGAEDRMDAAMRRWRAIVFPNKEGAVTLNEFITHYLGHGVISSCTGNQTAQCVDLVSQWSKNLGKGCFPRRGNAKDIFANADATKWRKVKNTPAGRPPAGAIVVWAEHNGYGHVAIARAGATASSIPSFDQNFSVPHRCTKENHKYVAENVIGWLVRR